MNRTSKRSWAGVFYGILSAGACILAVGQALTALAGGKAEAVSEQNTIENKYKTDAFPSVAQLRTKIEMYRWETGHLPGLIAGAEEAGLEGARSIAQTSLQTFSFADEKQQKAALWDFARGQPLPMTDHQDHFSEVLKLKASDFMRDRLSPNHVFYRAAGLDRNSTINIYAVGVFGDGRGLQAGTGYAVLEVNNSAAGGKMIWSWSRWEPRNVDAGQIVMASAAEHDFDPSQIHEQNICWIGDPEELLSGDPQVILGAMEKLKQAGWILATPQTPPTSANKPMSMTEAISQADGLLNSLRERLLLYYYDCGQLASGPFKDNQGSAQLASANGADLLIGGTSHLGSGFMTQGFAKNNNIQKGQKPYEPAMVGRVTTVGEHPGYVAFPGGWGGGHFAQAIGVKCESFWHKQVRPNHFHYWSPVAGAGTRRAAFALGIFGDGDGIPPGMGQAVLMILNSPLGRETILTWKRWEPVHPGAGQITFLGPDENPAANPATAAGENYCWVPSKDQLTTDDPVIFEAMVADLQRTGWKLSTANR